MNNIPSLVDSTLTFENKIATLTFNRHDVRNALTGTEITQDIVKTAEWVNSESEVAVLIITGAGSAFSAGGNIKDMVERSGDFAGDGVSSIFGMCADIDCGGVADCLGGVLGGLCSALGDIAS